MRAVVFELATGKVLYQVNAPVIDVEAYESDDAGAIEWDNELDPLKQWWVEIDVPIPGVTSITQVPDITEPNFYFDWTTHIVLPDLPSAVLDAQTRISRGRDIMMSANFTWSGNEFLGDQLEQNKIRNFTLEAFLANAAGGTFSVDWRLADGTSVTLDHPAMLAVFAAMQSNTRAAQDQGNVLMDEIDTAASITPATDAVLALNDIEWTAP